jgi:hypothetical protein
MLVLALAQISSTALTRTLRLLKLDLKAISEKIYFHHNGFLFRRSALRAHKTIGKQESGQVSLNRPYRGGENAHFHYFYGFRIEVDIENLINHLKTCETVASLEDY